MPYPAGDVTWIEDTDATEGEDAGQAARKAYADLVERVTDTRPDEAELTELDAYGMASTIAFDAGREAGAAGAAVRDRAAGTTHLVVRNRT